MTSRASDSSAGKVVDGNVRALAREGYGRGPADARVSAGDQRFAPLQAPEP